VIKPGDLKDGVKGKESVKKKAKQKTGTASVIGVAGVKGNVTKDKG